MSHIVDQFYEAIRTGDTALLDSVIAEAFCLICPTQDHVLSGIYEGKQRFFEEVTPRVFGCVNPEEITFCAGWCLTAAKWWWPWRRTMGWR